MARLSSPCLTSGFDLIPLACCINRIIPGGSLVRQKREPKDATCQPLRVVGDRVVPASAHPQSHQAVDNLRVEGEEFSRRKIIERRDRHPLYSSWLLSRGDATAGQAG